MDMNDRRAAYAAEYRKRFAEAKIDDEHRAEVLAVARKILAVKDRYAGIVKATGVPWWFIGVAHYRESSLDFGKHLHEGSPLTGRTRDEPKGRPEKPPANGSVYTFDESAIDALTMPGKHFELIRTWDVVETCLRLEQYNGFGYRGQGIPSPYLWAMTNQSDERGKYVRDHVFDRNAPDKQIGCIAILLGLQELGVILFPSTSKPVTQTLAEKPKSTAAVAGGAVATAIVAAAPAASHHPVLWLLAAIAVVAAGFGIFEIVKHHLSAPKE